MINKKHNEIINKVFKGDLGAEQALQNQAIMAILLRQDAIVASMTPTQLGKYDDALKESVSFCEEVREKTISKLNEVKQYGNS